MKTKLTKFCVITIATIMIMCAISACTFSSGVTYDEALESNWGIVLPEDKSELFRKSEQNWGDGGIRYAVFILSREVGVSYGIDEPHGYVSDFIHGKSEDIENTINRYLLYADIQIGLQYLPDWGREYYWKYAEKKYWRNETTMVMHELYMIYTTNNDRLIICQQMPSGR